MQPIGQTGVRTRPDLATLTRLGEALVPTSDTVSSVAPNTVRVARRSDQAAGCVSDWYCDEVLTGRRPIDVVAETDRVLGFHHTRPSYEAAHIVVIPKLHVPSLLSEELTDALLLEILGVVRKVASQVLREESACRVLTNLGDYQESKHLHWHIVSGARIADPVEVPSSATARRYTRTTGACFADLFAKPS